MIVWVAGETDTELFALTREGVDWHRLPFGTEALSQKVAAFRRGLNVDVVASPGAKPSDLFDLALAYQTYKDLLGPIEPLLKRKRNLLIVASGALTALPFQLLVTAPPSAAAGSDDLAAYRNAAWLVKQNAVTVVPSVASAEGAPRPRRARIQARKPMVGFGDPVFQPGAASPSGGQRVRQCEEGRQRQEPRA